MVPVVVVDGVSNDARGEEEFPARERGLISAWAKLTANPSSSASFTTSSSLSFADAGESPAPAPGSAATEVNIFIAGVDDEDCGEVVAGEAEVELEGVVVIVVGAVVEVGSGELPGGGGART